MRLRRTLTAAALAVVAATGLSACQNKIGLAASVDGHRLSDNDLASYVNAGAAPYTDPNSNATVVPKVYALENWINAEVFAAALASKGGAGRPAELSQARQVVLSGRSISDAETFYGKLGYTKKFAHLIVDQSATVVVLVERLAPSLSAQQALNALQNSQAGAELLKVVTAAKPKVAVSSRYGSWDAAKVTLTSTAGAGAPDFVRFASTPASAAAPTVTP